MAEAGAEVLTQPEYMLRFDDGSPVTIEFKAPGSEVDQKTGTRRISVSESFNPRFNNPLSGNTLVEINVGKDPLLFLVGGGQRPRKEFPKSVFVIRINREKFDELKNHGYKVVSPDNPPPSKI